MGVHHVRLGDRDDKYGEEILKLMAEGYSHTGDFHVLQPKLLIFVIVENIWNRSEN
jgi:hypothetical protein